MKAKINWHYSRSDIAQTIIDLFSSESTHAITVFAPRRMGKTELLLEDLWPLAKKRGYDVRYASFWMDKSNPKAVFLDAISSNSQDQTTVKARIGVGGTFVEATSHGAPKESDVNIKEIKEEFVKLCRGKKKVLLLLDEVQQLAIREQDETFVAALRTLLDTNKGKVCVVFTGSSREGLLKMFKKQKAPLFNFSHQLDLPELGSEFVNHMLGAFKQASGKTIKLAPSIRVFTALNRVPAQFHDLLRAMLINGRQDIEQALKEYKMSSGENQAFLNMWDTLKPLDKQVLINIANDEENLFSEVGRQSIANNLGLPEISKSSLQKSISRLKDAALIESFQRGRYEFSELAFRDFVHHK
ncbi:MAG: ATP-binding protein [Pseudomonadales bacterium]|nr:ATP-binding protein [Pseudomonadales bacterium]